jgi:hypothetical protein
MDSLINYTNENNLVWIIICDQHNAVFNPSVVKNFPFNLIDTLAYNRGSNIEIVISASANNKGYPTEMKRWNTHDISSHRFDKDEFKVWCSHYKLQNVGKINHESEEAVDALLWTGGVPYELDMLWKQPKETLMDKTLLYRENRVREMAETSFVTSCYQMKRNSISKNVSLAWHLDYLHLKLLLEWTVRFLILFQISMVSVLLLI